MRRRLLPILPLLSLLALPVILRAADDKAAQPTLVVRISSIDSLLADFRYLAALTDHEEVVKQFEGVLKAKTGPKGLQGLDTSKPFGLYGTVGPQGLDSTAVALVPIADEKAFLALLQSLNVKAEKGKDDLYTVTIENTPAPPIYFRFANGYVYATAANESAVDKDALLPPDKVLTAKGGTLSVVVRLDRIPDNIKQLALGQLSLRLADLRDRESAGKTEAQKNFSKQVTENLGGCLKSLLRDGQALSMGFDVDRKAGALVVEASLDGKPTTGLSEKIGDLGASKSLFAGLATKESAAHWLLHFTLPEDLRKVLGPVIDESIAKGLEKENDKSKREKAAEFLKVLEPTLKSGDLDAAATLLGPTADKHYTILFGMKLKDGAAVDKAVRAAVKDLPPGDRDRIKLDADKAGDVAIHRLDAQKDVKEDARKVLGDNPIYVAIRADALLVTLGENGLSALKGAVASQPGPAPTAHFEASLSQLAPLIAIHRKDDKEVVAKAAEEAFGKDKDGDRVRITVEGGKILKMRFDARALVLKFGSLLHKAEKQEK